MDTAGAKDKKQWKGHLAIIPVTHFLERAGIEYITEQSILTRAKVENQTIMKTRFFSQQLMFGRGLELPGALDVDVIVDSPAYTDEKTTTEGPIIPPASCS